MVNASRRLDNDKLLCISISDGSRPLMRRLRLLEQRYDDQRSTMGVLDEGSHDGARNLHSVAATMEGGDGGPYNRCTIEEVYGDYEGRRTGIIQALTTDVEEFYKRCDPDRENFCLFAYPNGQWEVTLPAEDVPPELPEPTLGINFARDGMPAKDWLALVAAHSEGWLLSVAFYFAARFGFDRDERKILFNMINDLPTVFEIVTGAGAGAPKKQHSEKSVITNHGGSKMKSSSKSRAAESHARALNVNPHYEEEEYYDEEEHGNTLCGACGKHGGLDEFWIGCDKCERWFHGSHGGAQPLNRHNRLGVTPDPPAIAIVVVSLVEVTAIAAPNKPLRWLTTSTGVHTSCAATAALSPAAALATAAAVWSGKPRLSVAVPRLLLSTKSKRRKLTSEIDMVNKSSQEARFATTVAIDKDRNSQHAVKWTLDNLPPGIREIVLVHVHTKLQNQDALKEKIKEDGALQKDDEFHQLMTQFFLPYRGMCARKGVRAKEVVLICPDITSALAEYVNGNAICSIVLGAANRNAIVRAFKHLDIPSSLAKSVPDFCTIYAVSRVKVQVVKLANRPPPPGCHKPSSLANPLPNSPYSEDLTKQGVPRRPARPEFLDGGSRERSSSLLNSRSPSPLHPNYSSSYVIPNASSSEKTPFPNQPSKLGGHANDTRPSLPNQINHSNLQFQAADTFSYCATDVCELLASASFISNASYPHSDASSHFVYPQALVSSGKFAY
nr:PHD finger protein ALFIN-LIKE 4-like [Ipomoea batatas]